MTARFRYMLDTNVVVDFLQHREPFYESSRLLMALGRVGEFELWLLESQFTDLVYILSDGGKPALMAEALQRLRGLRTFVEVYSSGSNGIDLMLASNWADPEDALIYEGALALQADAIITRNQADFEEGLVKALDCDQLFAHLEAAHDLAYSLVESRD